MLSFAAMSGFDGRLTRRKEAHPMNRSKIPLAVLSLLFLLTGLSVRVRAQAVYGSIIGTVVDPNGAAVAGATVTVTDLT